MKLHVIAGAIAVWTFTAPAHGQLDSVAPWRVQVRIHTCSAPDAGTDSKVFVRLTGNHLDRFWLARGGDDRKRAQSDTYDVWIREPVPGVTTTVANITEITFGINGADKWCFDRVELFVNNPNSGAISASTASAHRIFDSGIMPGGIWLSTRDAGDSRVIGSQVTLVSNSGSTPPLFRMLRGTQWNVSGFRAAILRCPRVDGLVGLDRAVMEQMFESFLGHLMGPGEMLAGFRYGSRVGRAHVTLSHVSDSRIRVDADIVPEGSPGRGTRRWDVEIVLEFTCVSGALAITAVDVDVDSRRWLDWLSLGLTRALSGIAERSGTRSFGSPVFVPLPVCVTPRFNHDGDLTFPGTGSVTCCNVPCS